MAHDEKSVEVDQHGKALQFPPQDDLKDTNSMKQTIIDAKKASDNEQSMTLLQGIKLYPKAIAWSILISTCIAMEGYDVALINNFYAFDTFNKKYGVLTADGTYQVSGRDARANFPTSD
jgi:SP family general alpha glucoside:H+ symporter-like MFS transporter